jgi:hypothetical protein
MISLPELKELIKERISENLSEMDFGGLGAKLSPSSDRSSFGETKTIENLINFVDDVIGRAGMPEEATRLKNFLRTYRSDAPVTELGGKFSSNERIHDWGPIKKITTTQQYELWDMLKNSATTQDDLAATQETPGVAGPVGTDVDPYAKTQSMADLAKTQVTVPLRRGGDLAATQPMGRSVPPLASVSGGDLEGQLPERPRRSSSLRRENKITKSHLQQIIKEELLVVLTDDEVMEMFGINPAKENNLLKLQIKK